MVGLVLVAMLTRSFSFAQESGGSIRGVIIDRDFEVALVGATVTLVETEREATTDEQGNYVFTGVAPGAYTLIFAREGYVRELRTDVVVRAGQLTDLDVSLSGEFTELEEFIVQDLLQLGTGTEAALLQLRFDSPSLLDSISSELMSRAGRQRRGQRSPARFRSDRGRTESSPLFAAYRIAMSARSSMECAFPRQTRTRARLSSISFHPTSSTAFRSRRPSRPISKVTPPEVPSTCACEGSPRSASSRSGDRSATTHRSSGNRTS